MRGGAGPRGSDVGVCVRQAAMASSSGERRGLGDDCRMVLMIGGTAVGGPPVDEVAAAAQSSWGVNDGGGVRTCAAGSRFNCDGG